MLDTGSEITDDLLPPKISEGVLEFIDFLKIIKRQVRVGGFGIIGYDFDAATIVAEAVGIETDRRFYELLSCAEDYIGRGNGQRH